MTLGISSEVRNPAGLSGRVAGNAAAASCDGSVVLPAKRL